MVFVIETFYFNTLRILCQYTKLLHQGCVKVAQNVRFYGRHFVANFLVIFIGALRVLIGGRFSAWP